MCIRDSYEVILAAGDGKLDDTDENQKSFDRVKAAIAHHEKDVYKRQILITDKKISVIQDLVPLLEQVMQNGLKLLIVAEDIELSLIHI